MAVTGTHRRLPAATGDVLFGDRFRWLLFAVTAALLAGLCLYGYRLGVVRHAGYLRMLDRPAVHAGERIDVSYGVVMDVNPRETTLSFKTRWVNVRPRIPDSRLGDIISIEGTVAADTSLFPVRVHFHRGQGLKLKISVLALVIFTIIFLRRYCWDRRRTAFEERGSDA